MQSTLPHVVVVKAFPFLVTCGLRTPSPFTFRAAPLTGFVFSDRLNRPRRWQNLYKSKPKFIDTSGMANHSLSLIYQISPRFKLWSEKYCSCQKKTSMTSDLPPLRKHIQPDTHTSPHVFSHQSSPKQLQLRSTESPHHLGPSSHWPHTGHPMTTLLACRRFLAGCFRLGQTKMRDYWCLLSVGVYLIRFDFASGRIPGTTSFKYWMLIVISWCKFRLLPGG